MIPDYSVKVGNITRWGDPWHGLITNGTLALPGSVTMATPGPAPVGGDCYLIQVPGQPAITTSSGDSALGMTWLNHALMCGTNHCLFGVALGTHKWIYLDENNSAWLASATFDIATGNGSIDFTRFGIFPSVQPPDVVQTATFSVSGTIGGSEWDIEDINETGNKLAIVTSEKYDKLPSFGWFITTGNRHIRGAFELVVSGVPPSASVSVVMIATQSEANGDFTGGGDPDYTYQQFCWLPDETTCVSIPISMTWSGGHEDRLVGVAYKNGVATKILRTLTNSISGTTSATLIGDQTDDPLLFNYSTSSIQTSAYTITFGDLSISITGNDAFSASGIAKWDSGSDSGYSGYDSDSTYTRTIDGVGGEVVTSSVSNSADPAPGYPGVPVFWYWNGEGDYYNFPKLFQDTDKYVSIWLARLGNGFFGLARSEGDFAGSGAFVNTFLTNTIDVDGVTSVNLSSTSPVAVFTGSRQPVESISVVSINDAVCYR